MDLTLLLPVAACGVGAFMAWGVGANDLANVMSTSIGSKSMSIRTAVIIAVIFEFAGAFLGGGQVISTITEGIINTHLLESSPRILEMGMLTVLMAGASWMLLASYFGVPVSITNTIIGSIVGFGSLVLGLEAVNWQRVSYIAISWVTSPLIAGLISFTLFRSIQSLVLGAKNPRLEIRRFAPLYFFLVGLVLSFMIVIKGLQHFNIHLTIASEILIAIISSLVVTFMGISWIQKITIRDKNDRHERFHYVEKVFAVLVTLAACAMIFAHGSNDIAITIGPIAVIINLIQHPDEMNTCSNWLILLGCIAVVLGLLMYGRKVIATVGSGITALTPSRAFAATLAAALTVIVSTGFGIPVSATQTLVGAVLGVGLARGIGALNLAVIRNILLSWVITLPATSALTILFYSILQKALLKF